MKKRVLLALLIVSVLVCLFAISVSAAESNEFGTVETFSGISEKSAFGDDGKATTYTSRVVLFDGTEYHTYPAYYVFTNNVNPTSTSFDELNTASGKSYNNKSFIRVEVPQNVKKVADVFRDNSSLKYVLFPDTLTVIATNQFYACHGLEWVNVPRDCVSIDDYSFIGCGALVTLDMAEAKSLKRTGNTHTFTNCSSLKSLVFPEGFEYFGGISGAKALAELSFPDSTTYVGGINQQSGALKTFKFPLGVTSIISGQFDYCVGLNTIIVHKGITSIGSSPMSLTYNIKEIIYTGSETDAIVEKLSPAFSHTYTAKITYGNHCSYYYDGEHLNDTNPCVINCTRCNSVNVPKENPVHSEITSISYVSYDAVGTKTLSCANKGCAYAVSENAPALFICLGYSAPENGECGLILGFLVNNKAITKYEANTGRAVKYGVFAVLKDTIGDNTIFSEDGTAANGVLKWEITNHEFSAFELKVVGFANEQKGVKLAMGAYVAVTEGDSTAYSYMQDDTKGEHSGKYYFASYNDVVGTPETQQ